MKTKNQVRSSLLFVFLVIGCLQVFGQETEKQTVVNIENSVFTVVEKMPEFPGGEKKMNKFIQKNIIYPPKARLEGRGGISYITFVVEKDGSLSDIKVLKGASGGTDLDEEALRVIKSMPKWKPGKQNGKKVRAVYNLPIRFIGV